MPISYLTPVFLTVFFVLFTAGQSIPRLLDIVPLISRTLRIEDIEVEADQIGWLTLEHNQQRFWYDQWKYQLEPGSSYLISYSPYSRHIITVAEAVESTAQVP